MRSIGITTACFFILCFMALNYTVNLIASIYGHTIGEIGMYLIFAITTVISIFFTAQMWDDLIEATKNRKV